MDVFTQEQMWLYFKHIGLVEYLGLPAEELKKRVESDRLGFLTRLMHRQLARIPFDSLALHYSPTRMLSLHPMALFNKLVVRERGGYCMEVNTFFATILRTLGYTFFSVGGRVNGGGVWGGWNHMLNIVTIDGERYAVDVGFGSNGPPHPIPLKDGYEFTTYEPVRGRLEYRALAQHTDPSQRLWVYSVQEWPNAPWEEKYAFVEIEFFPADFQIMNMPVMTAPQSFFVQNVMCLKFLLREGTDEVEGVLILHRDYVKRRVGNKMEILQTLNTEEERVKVLEDLFSIKLGEDEKAGIRGLTSELSWKIPQGKGHA